MRNFEGLNGVKPGDVLLRVNDETVLGRHHHEVVTMFAQVNFHYKICF